MKKLELHYVVLFCLMSLSLTFHSQMGCTDPQALNYDADAVFNNGSCEYSLTNYSADLVANLTSEMDENSGLIFITNTLYSINDGGNGSFIQELSLSGDILRTIFIDSTQNIDWEAISHSSGDLFIGDFGNNGGNRSNLRIHKVNKNDIQNFDTVQSSVLHFYYSDQLNFNNTLNQHNFDCEAFFYFQDSLHLFTKGWENLYTKHYVIPVNAADTVEAVLRDSLFVDGLITDATVDSTTGRILLLGYKNNGSNFYTSFIYLLFDYNQHHFFSGNKRRIEIGNMLNVSQTEGITFESSATGFISAEKISSSIISISPKLFHFDFTSFFDNPTTNLQNNSHSDFGVYPNPAKEYIQISFNENIPESSIRIIDFLNRTIIENTILLNHEKISTEQLKSGTYFVEMISYKGREAIPFVKN